MKHDPKRQMRRPFLLLELMIAFTLISLFAFPLIFNPLSNLNKELDQLQDIETERLSELLFAEIKEQFYLGEIPWKKIPLSKPDTPFQTLKSKEFILQLGDFKKQRIVHFDIYLYWDKAPKKDKEGREFGLLNCDLITKKNTFKHKLFLFAYQGVSS